jgi:hypothetical protein
VKTSESDLNNWPSDFITAGCQLNAARSLRLRFDWLLCADEKEIFTTEDAEVRRDLKEQISGLKFQNLEIKT